MTNKNYKVTINDKDVESFNVRISKEQTKAKVVTQHLRGPAGASAYKIALDNGFVGTEEDWLKSIEGLSAYEVALDEGFVGTREEWLRSLKVKVTEQDKGKILTNDGNDSYWESLEEKLNSETIEWDLGYFD